MSSLVRRIQKSAKAERQFKGRGARLGVHDKSSPDLTARLRREHNRYWENK